MTDSEANSETTSNKTNSNKTGIGNLIRVLIADDFPVVRRGLATIIAHEPDMTVVAQAADGRAAVDLYRQHRPDVALIDLRMPLLNGIETITMIRKEFRNARIIILTTFDTDEDVYQGLRAGARAYILKGASTDDLLEAVRAVHLGQKRIPSEMVAKLTERLISFELTEREREVLRLLASGKSNKEIAAELGVEKGTVRAHCTHLFQKLDVNDRTQAAVTALRRGLVRLEEVPP